MLRRLAVAVAEMRVAGGAFTERLGRHLRVDLLDTWKADRTFVDLLSDKAALGLIAAEWGVAPAAQATGSELRYIIGRQLDGQGRPPVTGWLPADLQFPFAGYAPAAPRGPQSWTGAPSIGSGRPGASADRAAWRTRWRTRRAKARPVG